MPSSSPEIHVYIEVDDLEAALRFYVDGLGLCERRRLRPHWVELSGAQAPIHVLARPAPDKDFSRHWTPVHLDFRVSDLDAALERALAAGGTHEGGHDYPGLWRLASLADPAGNGVDLIEMEPGAYERLAAAP